VCGHNFDAGELGPGTIVGSEIKHLRVFFITAFWSIFAYIWLYLILAVISPGIVEVGFMLAEFNCLGTSGRTAYFVHCFIDFSATESCTEIFLHQFTFFFCVNDVCCVCGGFWDSSSLLSVR